MPLGLLAKKIGMTQLFNEHGRAVPVTVVAAGPCTITQVKTKKSDGYEAVQVGFETLAEKRVTKPLLGHFKKSGTTPFRYIKEFRLDKTEGYTVGQQLTVDVFKEGELVDVTGISIGKGFQGGMKRHGWKGGPATHGSTSHRRMGSMGSTTTPGRVLRGHPLPGHMGNDQVTVQNLRLVKIDTEGHLLVLQGSVPGPEQRLIWIRKSIKKPGVITKAKTTQRTVVLEEEEEKGKKAAPKKK